MVVMPLRPPPDAEDKLREIRSVTDAALSHLGADDLLTTLLCRVREILDRVGNKWSLSVRPGGSSARPDPEHPLSPTRVSS